MNLQILHKTSLTYEIFMLLHAPLVNFCRSLASISLSSRRGYPAPWGEGVEKYAQHINKCLHYVFTHTGGGGGGGRGGGEGCVPELDNVCPLLSIGNFLLCGIRGNRHVERG